MYSHIHNAPPGICNLCDFTVHCCMLDAELGKSMTGLACEGDRNGELEERKQGEEGERGRSVLRQSQPS